MIDSNPSPLRPLWVANRNRERHGIDWTNPSDRRNETCGDHRRHPLLYSLLFSSQTWRPGTSAASSRPVVRHSTRPERRNVRHPFNRAHRDRRPPRPTDPPAQGPTSLFGIEPFVNVVNQGRLGPLPCNVQMRPRAEPPSRASDLGFRSGLPSWASAPPFFVRAIFLPAISSRFRHFD